MTAPPPASRYCILVQQKEKWEEQEGNGLKEKEELKQQVHSNQLLQQENLQLKTDINRYLPGLPGSLEILGKEVNGNNFKNSVVLK